MGASFRNEAEEVRPTPSPDRSVDEGQSLQTRSAEVFLGLTEHLACHGDAMMHSGSGETSKTTRSTTEPPALVDAKRFLRGGRPAGHA